MPNYKNKTQLVIHKEIIYLEKAVNFFNEKIVKMKIGKNEKPTEWSVKIEESQITEVFFHPTHYITPREAIIQRLIMGMVKDLFHTFEGTATEFKEHRFEITTGEIQSRLETPRLHREIRIAFDKLMKFGIKVELKKIRTQYTGILKNGEHNKGSDVWSFQANPMFQIMRKDIHRSQVVFDAGKTSPDKKTPPYTQVFINLNDILKLEKRSHQNLLYYFIIQFEKSNCQLPCQIYYLNDDQIMKILNKHEKLEKKTLQNYKSSLKKDINEIMAMEVYDGLFEWIGTGRNQAVMVNFVKPAHRAGKQYEKPVCNISKSLGD
jgi:hypothetical protein